MAEPEARAGLPYIWPTWIAPLIAGDQQCWYAAWFKAHWKYEKLPKDGNLEQWKADHAVLVAAAAADLRETGWKVTLEDQNKLHVRGETAVVGGKPDIVAVRPDTDDALVVDGKTGQPHDGDFWQVVIYLVLLTMKGGLLAGKAASGMVRYRDSRRTVTVGDWQAGKPHVVRAIRIVGSETAPEAVPSRYDCSRCDISCCPYREVGTEIEQLTDEF